MCGVACVTFFCVVSSCTESKQAQATIPKTQLVEQYINALNKSDFQQVRFLFFDSIRLKELDYVSVFSKDDYYHLFQWDSTFHPTYKILEIQEDKSGVKMKVSKECKRILFLNQEPIVTHEFVKFKDNKIMSVDIIDYKVFNDSIWSLNRANLVSWITTNHPELNGFLHDQSKQGALNYLKAIQLYQQSHSLSD